MKNLLILSFLTLSTYGFTFELTEKSLKELSLTDNANLLQLEYQLGQASAQSREALDQFGWQVSANAETSETNALPLITFQPVFSPTRILSVGVIKPLKNGVSLSSSMGLNDQHFTLSGARTQAITSFVQVGADIDLLRNFMGAETKPQLEIAEQNIELQKIQKTVLESQMKILGRRAYWSLRANQLKQHLLDRLIGSAQKQLRLVTNQEKESVADQGDIASYQYQLAQRQALRTQLDYQKNTLEENLKSIYPSLQGKELKLGEENINRAIEEVLECTQVIGAQKDYYAFSQEDEVLAKQTEMVAKEIESLEQYSKAQWRLHGRLQTQGLGSSLDKSLEDFSKNNRLGYTLGTSLKFNIGKEKETQKLKIAAQQARLKALSSQLKTSLSTKHESTVKSIQSLIQVLKSQKKSSLALEKRMKILNKKYNQARISLSELNVEEDRYLNSEVSVIDTQLAVLDILFNYLNSFTQTQCSFNQVNS